MAYVSHLMCTLCHENYDLSPTLMTCPKCGEKGILEVVYDYRAMEKAINKAYFKARPHFDMWRYAPLMSLETTDFSNTLSVGGTPHYRAHALEDMYDFKQCYLKDEGLNPTGSLKDRASAVAVIKAKENKQTTIACASTGNAASSLAGNAARADIKTKIFVPKRAPSGKLAQLRAFGADIYSVEGNYKAAYNLSKAAIDHYGWYNRNAAINPHLIEGKKTVAFEIAEQMDFHPPHWVVVSVGDGCTIGGVYKGFKDLYEIGLIDKIPRLLGVQAEGCQPFVQAFKNQRDLEESDEDSIADSIAVGIPRNPIKGLNAVIMSHGEYIAISDEAILNASKVLSNKEGIFAEPSAAAALAGAIEARRKNIIKHDETLSIIITGNGLKDPHHLDKRIAKPTNIDNNLNALKKHLEKKKEPNDE